MTDLFEAIIEVNFKIFNKADIIRKIKCNLNSPMKITIDNYIKANNMNLKKYYIYFNQTKLDVTKTFNEYKIKNGDNLIASYKKLTFNENYNNSSYAKSTDDIVITTDDNINRPYIEEHDTKCSAK